MCDSAWLNGLILLTVWRLRKYKFISILCHWFDRGAVGPYRKLAAVAVTPDDFPEGCEGLTLQSLLHRRSSTVYALTCLTLLHTLFFMTLSQSRCHIVLNTKTKANAFVFIFNFSSFLLAKVAFSFVLFSLQ